MVGKANPKNTDSKLSHLTFNPYNNNSQCYISEDEYKQSTRLN